MAVGALLALAAGITGVQHARGRVLGSEVHRATETAFAEGVHEPAWRARARGAGLPEEVIRDDTRWLVDASTSSGTQRARVAAMRTTSPIVGATPVDRGWVFVTLDGVVARSDSFLGTLYEVGRVPCPFRVERASQGRAVVIDAGGALWTTTGQRPFARVTWLSQVRTAAFVDARCGAAVLRDGSLWVTRDNATTWQREELHGDVAWAFARGGGELYATTSSGPLRLGRDGALTDPDSIPSDDMEFSPREEVRASVDPSGGPAWFRVASPGRCAGQPPTDTPTEAPDATVRNFLCRVEGSCTLPPLAISRVDATPPAGAPAHTTYAVGLDSARAIGWRDGEDFHRSHARIAWRGQDLSGPFAGATGRPSPWPDESGADKGGTTIFWANSPLYGLAGTRRGVLLQWRVEPDNLRRQVFWARAERDSVPIEDRSLDTVNQDPRRALVLTQPDGGAVAVFTHDVPIDARGASVGFPREGLVVGLALDIDPDGAVRGRRPFVDDAVDFIGLARWGQHVGPLLRDPRDVRAAVILPVDGGAPVAMPWLLPRATRACDDARPGVATTGLTLVHHAGLVTLTDATDEGRATEDDAPSFAVVETEVLEVGPDGACTRALSARREGPNEDFLPLSLNARGGSMFEGCYDDDATQRPSRIECHDEAR